MGQNIKELKLKDICKEVSSGNLDYRLAMIMINSFVNTLNKYSDMNVLIDQRDTSFHSGNLNEVLDVLESIDSISHSFTNKVANLVPNDQNRLRLAKLVKTALNFSDNKYKVFTDYDDALRWLAD